MKTIALFGAALLLSGAGAFAQSWSQIGLTTTAANAPQVVAAADALMGSAAGKKFPGKLLLQLNVADGNHPATHTFVPIYKSAAEREGFVAALQASDAWRTFQGTLQKLSQPGGTVMYRVVKSWGDINDTDHVWMAHAFQVSDAPAFLAAVEGLMASATGKKFPGQVYLSGVVAGGISPVTHVISVGYDSEAEMEAWVATRNASSDWAKYQAASNPVSDYLGGSLARDIKSWGPATLKALSMP